MNILFVHQNFPGQFKHLAPAMARQGHRVVALHINACPPVPGVELVRYPVAGRTGQGTHRWLADLDTKTLRGEAAWHAALKLREQGFVPDVIVAHPGWGESLFLQQVWPQARMGIYCEFFYQGQGADVGFDPEFGSPDTDNACRLQMENANYELHFARAHAGIAPTHWQASLFPESFASRIAVIHDGIRTDQIRRGTAAWARWQSANLARNLSERGEGRAGPVTRALCGQGALCRLLAGAAGVHCACVPDLPLCAQLEPARSHERRLRHRGQRHRPGARSLRHGDTGQLVDFFDPAALAQQVIDLCENPAERVRLGAQARAFAVENYDLETRCLPGQMAWVQGLR